VDITPVFELKKQAMEVMKAQAYLVKYYTEQAEHRGHHARRVSGKKEVKFAEAFQRVLPQVVTSL
jgi:4-oxalomesaconate hydratase